MHILMMACCEHALLRPDGKLDVRGAFNDPDGRPARSYLIMPLDDIVSPAPGAYRLELRIEGQTLGGPLLHLWEVAASRAN